MAATTQERMTADLRKLVEAAGTQKALAEQWGCTPQYISSLLNGTDEFSDNVLARIGWKKDVLVRYRKVRKDGE